MPNIPLEPVTFEFFARYVLAGFIVFVVRNAFVRGERPKIVEVALDIALFGLINQLVWRLLGWAGAGLQEAAARVSTAPDTVAAFALPAGVLLFLEIVALPALVGALIGLSLGRGQNWLNSTLRALAPFSDTGRRAYDFAFETRGPGFVILTYKDGMRIHGYYGPRSAAGRDAGRSDLYLERLYSVQPDGTWSETVPPRAVLVNLAELRSIEFLET